MEIDSKTIEWVSGLARLKLNEEEKIEMKTQLAKILEYMDVLNELDLEGIKPTAHTLGIHNVMRKDEVKKSFSVERVKKLAPEWESDHVVVPRIV